MPKDISKTPSTAPHPRSYASIRGSHTPAYELSETEKRDLMQLIQAGKPQWRG
ncbi:MAG: hypothetical protein JJU00_03830 [Opitutales bacterium]|nr:hypothetical protein [Opitutales bacterium]